MEKTHPDDPEIAVSAPDQIPRTTQVKVSDNVSVLVMHRDKESVFRTVLNEEQQNIRQFIEENSIELVPSSSKAWKVSCSFFIGLLEMRKLMYIYVFDGNFVRDIGIRNRINFIISSLKKKQGMIYLNQNGGISYLPFFNKNGKSIYSSMSNSIFRCDREKLEYNLKILDYDSFYDEDAFMFKSSYPGQDYSETLDSMKGFIMMVLENQAELDPKIIEILPFLKKEPVKVIYD